MARKSIPDPPWTLKEFADVVGISLSDAQYWVRNKLPRTRDGRRYAYDWESAAFYYRKRVEDLEKRKGSRADLQFRIDEVKAERAEIELEELRRNRVHVDEVAEEIVLLLRQLNKAIDIWPGQSGPTIVGLKSKREGIAKQQELAERLRALLCKAGTTYGNGIKPRARRAARKPSRKRS